MKAHPEGLVYSGSRMHKKEYWAIKLERQLGALKVRLKNLGFVFIGRG